jgi:hypothetical protein
VPSLLGVAEALLFPLFGSSFSSSSSDEEDEEEEDSSFEEDDWDSGSVVLRPLRDVPGWTGVPKCSGWVSGSWSSVSSLAKWRPDLRHRAERRRQLMSPSSKTAE